MWYLTVVKVIQAESTPVVARREAGEKEKLLVNGVEFQFYKRKRVL